MKAPDSYAALFDSFRDNILSIDPLYFCEKYLTLNGKPFKVNDNGYKPFADIYKYIAVKAIDKDAKPIVLVKGRQVGATTMAAALECYFAACGLYGTSQRAPMRMMHLFPTLALAAAYTKDKLDPMIGSSIPIPGQMKSNGLLKSYLESKLDSSNPANNNQHFKKFQNGNQVWIESTGLDGDRIRGRQLSLDTELPTPNGFIKLEHLKAGDKVFDENGDVCTVTKMHPINLTPEAYKITFDDGIVVEACADHLWQTYTKKDRIAFSKGRQPLPSVKKTKEILNTLKVSGESNHSIPVCSPVRYPVQNLPIDPYLLGIWLGDGDRYGRIETADPEILSNYNHRLTESSVNSKSNWCMVGSKSSSYRVIGLTTALTKLGLVCNPGKSKKDRGICGFYNKHIPENYMRSSFEQRLALLQGLMDSDGCCTSDGRCEFVQVESRKELALQVRELVHSLGIKTSIRKKESWRYKERYQDKYSLMFYTTLPVFRLKRKLDNLKNKLTKSQNRFIKSIEPIESKPMRCITVDSPSHLFLITRAFIPTHNSVDAIFYDEVQDMSDLAIGAAGKVASIAQHGRTGEGVRVFFGTPKTKGGSYWNMWQASSQNYFHLNCEKCGEFFPLYHPTVNWEDVWVYGKTVKCTHCNHEQDKVAATERGKWIPMNDPEKSEYVGYHFNQLYIPTFDKETIVRAKPDKSPVNTERVYMNEVLGEFYDGQGGTISIEDIHSKCADKGRKMASHLLPNENRKVYAGFDWGQKGALEQFLGGRAQGRSYSCAVILTADGPNILSIEFATRLMRNDPEAKQEVVEEMFRKYSVSLAVGDIGDAFDLTHRMQRMYGDAFLASRSSHRITGHIKFADDEFPKVIHFEKDYYISEILGRLKNGHIRFPYGSYDKIDWLISHCASMDIKITKDKSGEPIKRYVKGSGPNDGLMALLNAYLAWKFDITNGFKIKQPNEMRYDVAKHARQIDAVVGYIPRLFGGGRI